MNEQQFHKNVKITYPDDRNQPVVVECYVSEYMQVNVNDPNILRYADENGEIKIEFRIVNRETDSIIRSEVKHVVMEIWFIMEWLNDNSHQLILILFMRIYKAKNILGLLRLILVNRTYHHFKVTHHEQTLLRR